MYRMSWSSMEGKEAPVSWSRRTVPTSFLLPTVRPSPGCACQPLSAVCRARDASPPCGLSATDHARSRPRRWRRDGRWARLPGLDPHGRLDISAREARSAWNETNCFIEIHLAEFYTCVNNNLYVALIAAGNAETNVFARSPTSLSGCFFARAMSVGST